MGDKVMEVEWVVKVGDPVCDSGIGWRPVLRALLPLRICF